MADAADNAEQLLLDDRLNFSPSGDVLAKRKKDTPTRWKQSNRKKIGPVRVPSLVGRRILKRSSGFYITALPRVIPRKDSQFWELGYDLQYQLGLTDTCGPGLTIGGRVALP